VELAGGEGPLEGERGLIALSFALVLVSGARTPPTGAALSSEAKALRALIRPAP